MIFHIGGKQLDHGGSDNKKRRRWIMRSHLDQYSISYLNILNQLPKYGMLLVLAQWAANTFPSTHSSFTKSTWYQYSTKSKWHKQITKSSYLSSLQKKLLALCQRQVKITLDLQNVAVKKSDECVLKIVRLD
jgi:hypothetical protein